ncbi:MAG TPA: 30S ribosome-binding factor RbfA [Cyclobacteriaceae bacterium]|jgi:ribosome-binding factor A
MPATTRQQKFARLIQKEISEIFQQDKRGYLGNAFVTIADVQVSPDLSVARIYVSMMLQQDKAAILQRIESHKKEIRRDLGNRIGKQVRIIPELIFYVDKVEEEAMRLDALIRSLNIPPASDDPKEST